MKVHRVRMHSGIAERDFDAISLGRADRRTRNLPVVGPRREEHAGGDLDLAVDGVDFVFAEHRPVRTGGLAVILRPLVRRQIREVPTAQETRR